MTPWVAVLFAVSLLNSCEAQRSSAVTPVFVKKGEDLILNVDVDVPEDFSLFEWNFNKTAILVRFAPGGKRLVFDNFTERLEFPVKKFSVKLKNLQESDSGVYAARVTALQGDKQLAEYKVTVQGPVSPVELTVDSVDSVVSRSSASCNLTVTCSTQHSHINSTFRCVDRTCSQEGGEQPELTPSGASLQIYLLNSAIICNHSNHVNWTKDFNDSIIENLCPYAAPDHVPLLVFVSGSVIVIITILILVIIFGLLGLFLCCRKRGNYNREDTENTIYDTPQVQPPDQSPTDDASDLSPTSTYSLVGAHTGCPRPTETGDTALPESLYAQVEKPARS
ncbi:SLAM family member 7-like [Cebidichthys violaceus]|uniref:SLAM family member 7-like n=1 Tax=Cebidichthys violaceus TaxID=271503 RepID=UPI0035CB1D55